MLVHDIIIFDPRLWKQYYSTYTLFQSPKETSKSTIRKTLPRFLSYFSMNQFSLDIECIIMYCLLIVRKWRFIVRDDVLYTLLLKVKYGLRAYSDYQRIDNGSGCHARRYLFCDEKFRLVKKIAAVEKTTDDKTTRSRLTRQCCQDAVPSLLYYNHDENAWVKPCHCIKK